MTEIHYHLDENCSKGIRGLVTALFPINRRTGLNPKIFVTAADFIEETAWLDRELYMKYNSNKPTEFFITHHADCIFAPPMEGTAPQGKPPKQIGLSGAYIKRFTEIATRCANGDSFMLHNVRSEVIKIAYEFMRRLHPQTLDQMGFDPNRSVGGVDPAQLCEFDLSIVNELSKELENSIIINAFHKSALFRKWVRENNPDFNELSEHFADREVQETLRQSFDKQKVLGGITSNHVVVSNENSHLIEVGKIIYHNKRTGTSYGMKADTLCASCHRMIGRLQGEIDVLVPGNETIQRETELRLLTEAHSNSRSQDRGLLESFADFTLGKTPEARR